MDNGGPFYVHISYINVRHIYHPELTTVEYVGDVYVKWTLLSMVSVCNKCETYIPPRAHHCRIHISYIFYSGEL
jgi:hypothetical protein